MSFSALRLRFNSMSDINGWTLSTSDMSSIRSCTETSLRSDLDGLEISKSCRIIVLIRSISFSVRSIYSLRSCSAISGCLIRSRYPMTIPMGLPISWAIPDDNLPTDASFSARIISSCAFFSSRFASSRDCTVERSISLSAEIRRNIPLSALDKVFSSLSALRTVKMKSSSSSR